MAVLTMRAAVADRRAFLVGRPTGPERVALILAFTMLVLLRLPHVSLHGRVWAEEGTTFMRNAAVLPWWRAIFFSIGGYLNLVANLAGIVSARMVTLEQVRWVGPAIGLVFQLLPAILIVWSGFNWLQSRIAVLIALLLLATVPIAEEVWLSAILSQFHLTLCVALILAMRPARGWIGRFHLALIALAALCGPTAWFLFPLFAARAIVDRSPPRAVQAGILGLCILLQAGLFFVPERTQGSAFNLSAVVSMVVLKDLLIPVLDYPTVRMIAGTLKEMAEARTVPTAIAVMEVAFVTLTGVALWRRGRAEWFWMFASAVVIAVPSYAAARVGTVDSLHIFGGNRYAFAPQVLSALVLLGVAVSGQGTARLFARIGIAWLLVIGITEFRDDPGLSLFDRGPDWLDEVAAWRADHSHILRIWPDGWTLDLNAQTPMR